MHQKIKIKMSMRKLFTDHTIWTRMFIVDLLSSSPSIDYTTERLLKNQEVIGNFMKPYFGDIAGDNISTLFKEHITVAADLLKAIKDGDTAKATTLEEQWITNAENISTFLSMINPCYMIDELKDMFNTHLILVKYQFIARMNGDYTADIMYYDMGQHHILMISDYIAKGIIERFFEEETEYRYQTQIEQLSQEQTQELQEQFLDQQEQILDPQEYQHAD